jgi:iron-sulfur cluster assembly accessory protein
MLTLTENAQKAVQRFIQGADTPVSGLRISVTGGGCSGMQYAMSLVNNARSGDAVVSVGEISIFVDPHSASLLEGTEVDFIDSLDGSGFKFENPNAKASCGCGNSFSA